jgi:hypothetical protein
MGDKPSDRYPSESEKANDLNKRTNAVGIIVAIDHHYLFFQNGASDTVTGDKVIADQCAKGIPQGGEGCQKLRYLLGRVATASTGDRVQDL